MVKAWDWTRSTSSRSRWWCPSNMECSCAPTAKRTSASSARCVSWSTTSSRTERSSHLATLPLIAHSSPGSVVAYRAGAPIRAAQFLVDVRRVMPLLGSGSHVLNACADRYHFAVGLAASLLSGKVSLLPSTHTPEMMRQLAAFAPDVICLSDEASCSIALPRVAYPR